MGWIKITPDYHLFSANPSTSVLFLIGSDITYNADVKHKISEEHKKHSDLIMADDLLEHYNNLTLKTLYTLKFFIERGLC